MSHIEVTVGDATMRVDAQVEIRDSRGGLIPSYSASDVLDAAAAALLAIDTDQSVAWVGELRRLSTGRGR